MTFSDLFQPPLFFINILNTQKLYYESKIGFECCFVIFCNFMSNFFTKSTVKWICIIICSSAPNSRDWSSQKLTSRTNRAVFNLTELRCQKPFNIELKRIWTLKKTWQYHKQDFRPDVNRCLEVLSVSDGFLWNK